MSKEFEEMGKAREALELAKSALDGALAVWGDAKCAYEVAWNRYQLKRAQSAQETRSVPTVTTIEKCPECGVLTNNPLHVCSTANR